MPKNYNELKKRGLKGTVAIGIVAATLLLMHSCFSDKEIEKKEGLINIGEKKEEKKEELTSSDEKEKLVSSDENVNSSIKGGVVKANNSKSESLVTEGDSFKTNRLKGENVLKTQDEKLEDTQIFKVKKKSKNKNEVIGIASEDNMSDVNEGNQNLIKEEKKVKEQEIEEEHSLLVFGSLGFEKINHSNSKDTGSTDPIDPIDPDKPDIDDLLPITPEVPVTEVIIWENGNEIYGNKYTLKNNLEMIDGVDGLKTTGGTITNEATINSDAWFGKNYAMRAEDHVDGRQGVATNKGNITGGSNGMIATNGGEIINETTGTINVLGIAMTSDGVGTLATNKGNITGEGGGMTARNSGTVINEGTTNGMRAYINSTATNKGTAGGMSGVKGSLLNLGTINNGGMGAQGGSAINEGFMNNSVGFHVTNKGTGLNKGEIRSADNDVHHPQVFGMEAESGSTIINEGTIISNHTDGGMKASGLNSMATNKGNIQNNSGSGMIAYSDATAINEQTGTITGTDNHYGMEADGVRALATNNGTISNNGTNNMLAYRGAIITNEESGILSNSKEAGMEAGGGNGSTAINKGTIKDSQMNGMRGHTGTHVENTLTGKIINSKETGIYAAGGGSTGVNFGTISDSGIRGMYTDSKGTIINEKGGKIIASKESGMHVNGAGAAGINKGTISGSGSSGMYADNEGTVINEKDGKISSSKGSGIHISGLNSIGTNDGKILDSEISGMFVENKGTIINTVNGEITNSKGSGIHVDGSKSIGTNIGSISGSGISGMYAENKGTVINEKDGKIIGSKGSGIHVSDLGSTGTNNGEILDSEISGMHAENEGTIINTVDGKIINSKGSGMYISGAGAAGINKGTISGSGQWGMYTEGKDSSGINDGEITSESQGMYTSEGTITNNDLITINRNGVGMETDGGTAINKGTITSISGSNIGIRVYNNGTAVNEGTISTDGDYGMHIVRGTGINEKGATTSNTGDHGMYIADAGIGTNKGTISNTGKNGMTISGAGSTGINEEGATISNTGDHGMYIADAGIGTNKGMISNAGDYGMHIIRGTGINEKGATISNTGNYRMHITRGGTGINNGNLDDESDNYIVMRASDSDSFGKNTGTIDINYSNSIAMDGVLGGSLLNEGTININGDNSVGMSIHGGGTATNELGGIINLNSTNGIGIYASGKGSKIVNNGEINLSGKSTDGDKTDDKGNRNIVLEDGATFLNSGVFRSEGNINFDDMGDGKFIMSSGGTVKADAIKGDIYASGALAMGGYDDVYSTYKMLETNELDGNIISNSAMFDAHFTDNADDNGFYDVVLDRKDFNTIVSNEKLGEILENNYEDNGNELKEDYYDALKLVSTEKGLDKAVEDSYGMSYYPTLAKQTFEIVNDSNQVIVDNVINNERVRRVGETIAIAGTNATRLENDSLDNASGYDTDLYSVYLGAEKQINKNTRIGGIITIGKGDTDLNDIKGSREDYYYQGNVYFTYENEDRLKFTSMIFGGITDTSLERTLAFGSLYETMEDDINNYYVGLNNELSKKYYFGQNYIKPKFELNFTYMMQDDISESGDQGLEIDGVNSVSMETGLGLALGRDFYFNSGSKVNLEGSVTGYAELGDPYKDLDSTFNTLSADKVKIDGYNNDDFYGDIMIGGSYETKDSLKLYTKIGYRIGNNSDGPIGNIGFNYLF